MNKEELKKSIDLVEPDPYMATRLKAKSIPQKTYSRSLGRIAVGAISLCLVFAMLFGFNLTSTTNAPITESQTSQSAKRQIAPFIMIASAVEGEASAKEYKTLELNVASPFVYKISVIDVRGMSEGERDAELKRLGKYFEDSFITDSSGDFVSAHGGIRGGFENIIFVEMMFNQIILNLSDKENLKSINVKTSGEWGYVEYNDPVLLMEMREKYDVVSLPHGTDITVTADQYHQDSGGFAWRNSYKLDNALNDNPDMPLSTFTDTITFTVEYEDGSKEIGVIDVVFDDDGNASFTSRDYSYVE